MSTPTEPEHPVSLWAGFLSYLVPGLGQISQGRFGKGILFIVCLISLFHVGQAMGDWKNVYIPASDELSRLQDRIKELREAQPPDVEEINRTRESIKEVAGESRRTRLGRLPNNLYERWHYLGQFWIGVSAWPALWQYFALPVPEEESHPFLHNLQSRPSEAEINRFWLNSDKTPDLGWIYTVIAGVLNILVIYDAYAGPAFHGDPNEKKKVPKPQEAPA